MTDLTTLPPAFACRQVFACEVGRESNTEQERNDCTQEIKVQYSSLLRTVAALLFRIVLASALLRTDGSKLRANDCSKNQK